MTRHFLIFITLLGLIACKTTSNLSKYELYNQYDKSKFEGQFKNKTYQLYVDSTSGMQFDGKLLIQNDTLLLHGFEKGSIYPTQYWTSDKYKSKDAKDGLLFIKFWPSKNKLIDSLKIYDIDRKNGLVKDTVTLYRKPI